jgi:translocation and assembly module TamB
MLRTAASLVLGFVILAVAAFGALQTGAGKAWLAATLNRAFAGPSSAVRIGAITGFVPFDFAVSRIELADGGGSWLIIDKATLAWSPSALLHGMVRIDRLAAARIDIARRPLPSAGAGSGGPLLPSLPVGIDLSRLEVGRLVLGAAVTGGDNAEATIAAHGMLTRDRADIGLKLTRTDGQPGAGNLDAHYDLAADALDLRLDVAEPTGVLLDALLARTDHLPLNLTLTGGGPLSDWKGRFQLAVRPNHHADDIHAEAVVEIAHAKGTRLTIAGAATIAPLLPANVRPIVGDAVSFSLIGAEDGAGGMMLAPSRIALASVTIDAKGAKSDSGALSGKAHIAVPDIAAAGALVGAGAQGSLSIDAVLSGTVDQPKLDLSQQGAVAFGAMALDGLTIDARVAGIKGSPPADPDFDLSIDAKAESVRDTASGADYGAAALHVAGAADSLGKRIEVKTATASGGGVDVTAAGSLRDGAAQATASVKAGDLAILGAALGRPIGGSASFDLTLMTDRGGVANLTLSGAGDRLRTGIEAVDALLAGPVRLDAAGARRADGSYGLANLTLQTARARLAANGGFDPAGHAVNGLIKADLADLGAVSAALASPLAGSGTVSATIGGTLESPAIDADARLDRLAYRTMRIDHIDAKMSAPRGLAGPATARGRIQSGKLAETLDAAVTHESGGVWRVDRLRMAGSGGTAEGSFAADLSRRRISGTLDARIGDLSSWSGAVGESLAGRASVAITLPANGEGPVNATLDNIVVAGGGDAVGLAHMSVAGRVSGDFSHPGGNIALAATGLAAAGGSIAAADAHIAAKGDSGDFSLHAKGRFRQPASLELAGSVTTGRGATSLRIASLAAKLGGNMVSLTRPVTATIAPGAYRVAGLALAVDGGTLQGDLALSPTRASADIRLSRLPLNPFALLAGEHFVGGTVDGRITLTGAPRRPQAHLSLTTTGLDLETDGPLPRLKLDLTASADWRGTRADLDIRLASKTGESLTLSGSAPLAFDLAAFAMRPSSDQALALKLTGGGRLENLTSIVPLGEDRVTGAFSVDVSVAGTMHAPQPAGRIAITGGRYVNMALGTEIDGIDLAIDGARDHFVLDHLRATDGKTGTLTASGSVDLRTEPATIGLDVGLADFLVARGDDTTVAADGALKLGGTLAAMKLSGKIGVRRAELYIPDRLPPSIVRLDVIEIGGREKSDTPNAAPLEPIGLDLALDAPGGVFVRGHGVTSEWRGQVNITGSTAGPVLTGQLSVINGSINLLGQTFGIDSGVVRFDGRTNIDPSLAVQASATASGITAQVNVTGTARAPQIALSSIPTLPRDEILSRVLFGSSVGSLTPSQGIQLAAAAAQLAQGGPGILDRVRATIGLDRLDLTSGSGTTNGTQGTSTGAAVSGGKYIANGVFVGVAQGLSGNSSQAKVEVEITPQISINSTFGTASGSGFGAKYSIDY